MGTNKGFPTRIKSQSIPLSSAQLLRMGFSVDTGDDITDFEPERLEEYALIFPDRGGMETLVKLLQESLIIQQAEAARNGRLHG